MKLTNPEGESISVGIRATASPVRVITLEEFLDEARAQGAKANEDIVFVCPMCGTAQTALDLIEAGAGENFEAVGKHLGFSCVGRWKKAEPPRSAPDGKPCTWTLGGFLQFHRLEIITPDGDQHPRFELATPEQAQAYWAAREAAENKEA